MCVAPRSSSVHYMDKNVQRLPLSVKKIIKFQLKLQSKTLIIQKYNTHTHKHTNSHTHTTQPPHTRTHQTDNSHKEINSCFYFKESPEGSTNENVLIICAEAILPLKHPLTYKIGK